MKTVEISYFYPTSHFSRALKMPEGGYVVTVTSEHKGVTTKEPEHGFANLPDAFAYAKETGFAFTRWSLTPELPSSCAVLEAMRAVK